ncbi:unnamed protein product [Chironomus riparius]|uniref:Nucleolar protein 4 helical domain-containing protein n=1 Tax=Chironomus riparius TaxID=315576 RepID=A0A9N9WSY7_9DIPT|nr:unnamed protein product [Chironomus riparius]
MNENCTNKNSSSRHAIKISRNSQKLKSENPTCQNNGNKSLLEKSGNQQRKQQQTEISLLNCDNKINHCNRYDVSDGLFSGHSDYRNRKLSIDDESSHPINASNTNNKIERKRNINMLNDIDVNEDFSVGCKEVQQNDDDGDVVVVGGGNTKRMKVDCDGQDNNKSKMYQIYQPWVLHTYGDQSKSKTITLKKQSRIVSTLKGLEMNRPDSSKFRFWVKSKGFISELPKDFKETKKSQVEEDGCLLFIPCKPDSSSISSYKRVAVVEYFFNIIYKVHCSVDEGEGRHVGQKRTYRKITEYYAFLPREAVTKFLTQCHECRRSIKTPMLQEIAEIENKASECKQNDLCNDNDSRVSNNQQQSLSDEDYPKNIENYYLLLRALYENSSLLNRIKDINDDGDENPEQSCEEAFKENNLNKNNKNKNVNTKNDLNESSVIEKETNHGNIIINSLDVSINVAGKTHCSDGSYGNINKVRISCTTTPTKLHPLPTSSNATSIITTTTTTISPINQQLGTAPSMNDAKNSKNVSENENNKYCNDAVARAASYIKNSHGVMRIYEKVPDDLSLHNNYQHIKHDRDENYEDVDDNRNKSSNNNDYDDNIKHTTNTPCNNNLSKYTNGENDIDNDYHTRDIISIDTSRRSHLTGDIKPITSTYLLMTRSMGLSDTEALNLDSISSQSENHETNLNAEDSYANLLKDADKLKLMLLAWNYQNSAAIRNNANGPDLTTMTNLWEQYQNALTGINVNKTSDGAMVGSPSPSHSQEDANSPSDNKEEDEASEDESDERIDQASYDPERLKAFNMFVRLFVDENLDRMVPISKQPKEKVQAIIDSCARQFPDFSERARKRLRTYLKSCRRNKKVKDGWENQPSRPTPAHLTSVQAEQILSLACENESLNAKRMRLGMEPISQSLNIPSSHSNDSQSAPSLYTMAKSSSSSTISIDPTQPLSISTNVAICKSEPIISTTTDSNANSINSILNSSRPVTLPTTTTPYDFGQAFMQKNSSPFYNNSMVTSGLSQGPTDLSVKRPLLPHNLNVTEAAAVKQLITGYREAAAFLLRSADELEQLLLNQQP